LAASTAQEYTAALEKAMLKDIEPVLVEMAEGEEPYLELEELTMSNKTRLMVMEVDRPRLLRYRNNIDNIINNTKLLIIVIIPLQDHPMGRYPNTLVHILGA
jgi:hypothetical protein